MRRIQFILAPGEIAELDKLCGPPGRWGVRITRNQVAKQLLIAALIRENRGKHAK